MGWTASNPGVRLQLTHVAGLFMQTQRDEATQAVLSQLLDEHQLTGETRFYREAERASLIATPTPGVYHLAANAHPSEAVIDVYGAGYLVQAELVGPGLAFAETATPNWQETMERRALRQGAERFGVGGKDRVEVEVRLADLLLQGGRMYPVESVAVERVWYFTLPAGGVDARVVL
jgi:hypothetical protein